MALPEKIREEKDLEPYERLFANTAYWKRIGEEYQNPLIVTGTVLFMPHSRSGFVSRDVEQYDSFGRRRVVPVRTYLERKGFILRPKFVFIDGRTGATMHSESYREEVLYNSQQNTPALSSYFELMDRLVPEFPDRAQQPEDPRHARAAALDSPHCVGPRSPSCRRGWARLKTTRRESLPPAPSSRPMPTPDVTTCTTPWRHRRRPPSAHPGSPPVASRSR